MNYTFHFDIRVVQDEDVTVATVEAEGFEHLIASAKRHPRDDHDPIVGQVVALERLFARMSEHYKIARQILADADAGGETAGTGPEADFWAQFEVPAEELG